MGSCLYSAAQVVSLGGGAEKPEQLSQGSACQALERISFGAGLSVEDADGLIGEQSGRKQKAPRSQSASACRSEEDNWEARSGARAAAMVQLAPPPS